MTVHAPPASQPLSTDGAPPQPVVDALRVDNVDKTFRQGGFEVRALRGLSLTIGQGEFVAVMGASGSGKSTFLHLAAGLTRADQGRIIVAGHEIDRLADHELTAFRRTHIGLVFQAFNLIATLTAKENILLPATAACVRENLEERLRELTADLGISDCLARYPDGLSGGQQQRVAIARALLCDPDLVLADEPTGSLDSAAGQQLCRILREQNERNRRTIVVVTHEPSVAAWADRVVILKDGGLLTHIDAGDFSDSQALASRYQEVISQDN